MQHFLSYLMFGFGVITLVMAYSIVKRKEKFTQESILFACFSLGSSIWSICFGVLMIQTQPEAAYWWRSVGMVGTFAYLIFGTLLMLKWSGWTGIIAKLMKYFSYTAIVLYPFLMQRENVTYKLSSFGMSYTFKPGIWNNAYLFYCVVVALDMFIIILYICKFGKRKRERVVGKRLIMCEIVLIFGMALDTIMPMFGVGAFPGSSIAQFFAVILIYNVYRFERRNRVNIANMSQFVYYSVELPVLIYDEMEKLRIVNKSAVEFFELPEEYEDIVPEILFDLDRNVFKEEQQQVKIDAECRNNQAHCRLGVNKILDDYDDVIGYIIIVDDLTDKVHIIEELEEAKKAADTANRAKSAFLAKMSHEIRTPLNTVLGMDEMILRENPTEKIRNYANSIKRAGKTLLDIINDILDLSKVESGKLDIIEDAYVLPEMLRDIINVISLKRREKGLGLELILAGDAPSGLYGDELRVKQVITNIMNNAVKYTEKGKITLSLEWKPLEEGWVELCFKVTDTGTGIKEEDMARLFAPYERLEEKKNHRIEGTGLGLAITKNLLELMGGTMKVESVYGEGTTFTISITQKVTDNKPMGLLTEESASAETEKEQQDSFVAPELKILAVDDTVSNLMIIRELLRRTKIKVELAKSGEDCLRMAGKKKYDLIFLDHMMPGMDGLETLDRMREMADNMNEDTPVIALTANAIVGAREMYLEHGFTNYLSKPIEPVKLEKMILEYAPEEKIEYVDVDSI